MSVEGTGRRIMGRKPIDFTGKRMGMLTVIERVENDAKGKPMWLCKCDCGNIKVISSTSLTQGTKSCGCYRREWARETHTIHGFVPRNKAKERLFNVWWRMLQRCYNPNATVYKDYGGRGITVCDEWRDNYGAFREWAYANGYNDTVSANNCTIDRIDNNGNYEPSNCRWTNKKVQSRNTRANHIVELDGETLCVAEWAERYDLPYNKLLYELNKAKKEGRSETGVLKGFIVRGFIYG